MTASGSGLIPTSLPPLRRCRFPCIVEASGLSEDEVRQIIADNTKGKTLGVFGEETVNVLGVNLDIALAMGLVGEISNHGPRMPSWAEDTGMQFHFEKNAGKAV